LVEILLEQASMRLGLEKLRSLWVRSGLVGARLVWTFGTLYFTVPVIADELTKVSRLMGLRPVLLIPVPGH
jgi:hypothetical protein